MAIVSIAVVALLGGVLATTTASAAGRNTTTVDTVLKSFAETARYNIQTQAPDGVSGPQFFPCAAASDYKVISAPYPSTGPTGSVVTVFATGFSPSVGTTVTFTSTANSSVTGSTLITESSSGPAGAQAGAMVTFSVPALQPGSYTITPFGTHDLAASNFTVTAGGTPSNALAFEGYQLNASIEYWSGSGWVPSGCRSNLNNADLQQLSYQLVDTQTGNGAGNSASFVVADFTPLPVPTLVVSCRDAHDLPCGSVYSLGSTFTFTATLSGFSNLTGTITWTGIPTGYGCDTTENVPPLTVTCTVTAALAGTLGSVGAVYSGDPTHSGVAALLGTSITVNSGSIALEVTNSGTPVLPGADLTFTVNVSGIVPGVAPTNQLQLILTTNVPNSYASTSCSGTVPLTGNSPPAITCDVDGATGGSYRVTATYPGDANYSGSSSSSTVIVQFPGAPTLTYSPPVPTLGNQLTFTATITQPAGAPAPTGTITWTGTNLPASCTSGPIRLPATSPYSVTCTVLQATKSVYSATATYSGDTNYTGGSASITAPIALYGVTPVLTCNHCALRHPGGTFTVTVTITPPVGAPAPTGTITWIVAGNANSCTGGSSTHLPSAPGPYTATCTISHDARGNYQFTAIYSGDSNYAQESSAVLSENVR
jgi:large repetitive protein